MDNNNILDVTSSLLEKMNGMRNKINVEKEKSLEKYRELIDYYNTFLDYIIEELLKFDLNTSLDYSIALSYLIKNGFLSNEFVFNPEETDKEIFGKLGVNIIVGNGCCRNISSLHQDVFDKLGFNIIPFYCILGENNADYNALLPNHKINLINYNDNLYGIDLFNNDKLYHFKNSLFMKSISNYNTSYLKYVPIFDLIMEGLSISDVSNRLDLYANSSKNETIVDVEYEFDIRKKIKELLLSNDEELKKFHNKTKTLRKEITSRMKFDN